MKPFLLILLFAWTASAANLLPNSSFECGAENWLCFGSCCSSEYGNDTAMNGRLTSTNSVHGNSSYLWRTYLFSPPRWLPAGNWVLTYSMMAASSCAVKSVMCAVDYTSLVTNGVSNPAITVGVSWARQTNFITTLSNQFYSFEWVDTSGTLIWVDAVQLETGTVATAYSPMATVEAGLCTTNTSAILNAATPNYLQLKYWNNGGTVGATSIVQVFNHENTNLLPATAISTNALVAGATTINVTLPAKVGWMRAVSYQPAVNNSLSEMTLFVRPYAASTAFNTNGLIGGHPYISEYSLKRDREAGYTWSRDLSPAQLVRWEDVQPNGSGPFSFVSNFKDAYMSIWTTNGLVPLLVLTPGLDGAWPRDATNGNPVQCDINAWSNYCRTVCARYSPAPSNCWTYEIGNEPHNILTPTDFSTNASNRARFLVAGAQAVKSACPNCTVVGIAGDSVPSRAWATWTNMTAPEQALVDVISAHLYPLNSGAANPNLDEDDLGYTASALIWAQTFAGTGKPLWDSECGNQGGLGGLLGPLAMFAPFYRVDVPIPAPEASRDFGMGQRKVVAVCREARQTLRVLGCGFSKIFMYRTDTPANTIWNGGYIASSEEFNGSPRQGAAASLIAANFFARNPGLGRVTNSGAEAYYFTNALGTVVALWTGDNAERTLTFTNAHFGQWDVMGNLLTTNSLTMRIGRVPQYIVSGDLTTAQLKANVETATTNAYTDINGPNISIDQTPIGTVTNGTFLFKWTLTDKNKQAWSIGSYSPDNTNNRSRVKFYGADTWRDVGESNHIWAPLTVDRQLNLIVEGKDFYNNTMSVTGPAFGILEAPPGPPNTNIVNISIILNIGNLHISP